MAASSAGKCLFELVVLALFVASGCSQPRFVHADNRSQYVLFDRISGSLCWSGPANDMQAFMNGGPVNGRTEQRPSYLRLCKDSSGRASQMGMGAWRSR